MRRHAASTVRSFALRRRCFSLAKTCSMGLRSGLWGQEEEPRSGGFDDGADSFALVACEVVHDHDIAGL
jgi:hypothetical protein